jgi:sulfite reductase (NADPH) flavoprotein alpha-component
MSRSKVLLRSALFQAHWLIGITAGIVLALVGVTGAMLSFEHQILDWLNRDVRTVQPRTQGPLAPSVLLERVRATHPDRRIMTIAVSSDPGESARVTFAPRETDGQRAQAGGPPGGRGPRGETRYVDPYTGEVFANPGNKGETFFRTTMQLHRWLIAGSFGNRDIGRHIVGASTALLVFLALSGLYLRWPSRRERDWRAWLAINTKAKGSRFLWSLHAAIGTWVLVFYLVMALTGLNWSYEWYRNGLRAWAGMEQPQSASPGGRERSAGSAERRNGNEPRGAHAASDDVVADVSKAWAVFLRETQATRYDTATLTLPRAAGDSIEIRYLDADPPHERAYNTLAVDAASGEVTRHERYTDKRLPARLVTAIFPLHSGSFFGLPGVILFMLASLAMPIFAVTGWMLYLERRRRKRARERELDAAGAAVS